VGPEAEDGPRAQSGDQQEAKLVAVMELVPAEQTDDRGWAGWLLQHTELE